MFDNSKMHLSLPVAYAAVRSKAVVLLMLIPCSLLLPLYLGVLSLVLVLLFSSLLSSIIAIILMAKRELIALLKLSSSCHAF